GKLADCQSTDRDETELYLVEGDSAGGTAKQARDRKYQAILPLRGKILNVEKARVDKMLDHEEIQVIITALGTGFGAEDFDISKLRYGKIIIMTDADVDGSHIRTLLLTFFYRQMLELVRAGRIYIAAPPLYKLTHRKKERYITNEKELKIALLALGTAHARVEHAASGRAFSGAELDALVRHLVAMDVFHERFSEQRGGGSFREYVEALLADGRAPRVRVTLQDGSMRFFRDRAAASAALGHALESVSERHISDVHDADSVESALAGLSAWGLSGADYFGAGGETRLRIVLDGEAAPPAQGLVAVLEALRRAGEQGVDIQRYKGLGEMNAEQLWDSTMNPATRSLHPVSLRDEVEADHLFSVLMGPGVEPRREYIEKHALEVRNLDI
ncbi:MAG TPA: toprim domain-containing protein, partial [Planctomycetota bacterium]|nr:toprim domain-containing protein [Planctomycetota bacterium]